MQFVRICNKANVFINCGKAENFDNKSDFSQNNQILSLARLYVALLKTHSSSIPLCLSKNAEEITDCAKLLMESAEKMLWFVFLFSY